MGEAVLMVGILWLLCRVASADEPDGDGSTEATPTVVSPSAAAAGVDSQKYAEYVRLSQELQKLAARNAWSGVERTWIDLVATGVPPTFEDYLNGANAAKSLGDVTEARDRLLKANTIKEDRQVLDWLWEIDSSYGMVSLMADPGAVELKCDAMPFDPNQAKAVDFAVHKVVETGTFEGYLPQGTYQFGGHEVKVLPRVQAMRVDMRSDEYIKQLEREKRAKKKKDE